jgi:hypothetical protein
VNRQCRAENRKMCIDIGTVFSRKIEKFLSKVRKEDQRVYRCLVWIIMFGVVRVESDEGEQIK